MDLFRIIKNVIEKVWNFDYIECFECWVGKRWSVWEYSAKYELYRRGGQQEIMHKAKQDSVKNTRKWREILQHFSKRKTKYEYINKDKRATNITWSNTHINEARLNQSKREQKLNISLNTKRKWITQPDAKERCEHNWK